MSGCNTSLYCARHLYTSLFLWMFWIHLITFILSILYNTNSLLHSNKQRVVCGKHPKQSQQLFGFQILLNSAIKLGLRQYILMQSPKRNLKKKQDLISWRRRPASLCGGPIARIPASWTSSDGRSASVARPEQQVYNFTVNPRAAIFVFFLPQVRLCANSGRAIRRTLDAEFWLVDRDPWIMVFEVIYCTQLNWLIRILN